ncbi:FAD-dependent oxidoreductase [Jeotgalibacillus proteolyticus]|uniref:FAD-dependent oxidoreductase n=1 Tax=Jeotgalibacillus proteolyticus TaxID=2082395 RepID=A0A2S5G9S7_9BACL|nr:FAD-dependent oxidoreductase [Jeotgalibacillus proteolyticus]PPA69750.1 FAD-dependent oxidoreductase [Jeotgalibacillus proteolyticus]
METNHEREAYWRDSAKIKDFPALDESRQTDVTVVGGGITGLTTAYLLSQKGLRVTVIEASEILSGTTRYTTAKVTAQHGVIYDELIEHFGIEKARQFFDHNQQAVDWIRQTVQQKGWDCDFEDHEAWLYASSTPSLNKLLDEQKAYEKLDIPFRTASTLPFDIPIKGALIMKNQAQFHPLKYLAHMTEEIISMGGQIHEHTKAVDIKEDDDIQVEMESGHVLSSQHVVIATSYPFWDAAGLYFARLEVERSYIVSGVWTGEDPGGMYLSVDSPSRSIRFYDHDGKRGIMVGGDGHKTGQGGEHHQHIENLKEFTHAQIGPADLTYEWSAQDNITLDKLPYIGSITNRHPRVLVATGFRKWGMTQGTMAAQIMTDQILGVSTESAEMYEPSRFKANPSIKQGAKLNADTAFELVKGKLESASVDLEQLSPGKGGSVKWNGKTIGAYRDETGKVLAVDLTCTHMGCECNWNESENSWDCPCHGSRFAVDGEVLNGPALKPLKVIDTEKDR